MKKYFLLILLFCPPLFSQNFICRNSIGDFKDATSFYINPTGFIYVTDAVTDEVYMIDTLGNIKNDVGGYGWNDSNFDDPVDIFATSLNIYVTDKNNHRIQRFDKDLNFISKLFTRKSDIKDEQFGYPLSAATSNQGDLYVLDSENNRVLKFDLFGNFVLNFGGYNDPNYNLKKPKKLAISPSNNIFVLDGTRLVIFDNYGNTVKNIDTKQNLISIRIIFNSLVVNTTKDVYFSDLKKPGMELSKLQLTGLDNDLKIVSSLIFNKRLYILTHNKIFIFSNN